MFMVVEYEARASLSCGCRNSPSRGKEAARTHNKQRSYELHELNDDGETPCSHSESRGKGAAVRGYNNRHGRRGLVQQRTCLLMSCMLAVIPLPHRTDIQRRARRACKDPPRCRVCACVHSTHRHRSPSLGASL